MNKREALIAGASGLVGRNLLSLLLSQDYYDKIHVLSRRPLGLDHPKIVELIIDFDELRYLDTLPKVQDVYCCLGTTMKKAGSEVAFRKVDYTYPLHLARKAAAKGAERYLLVSAMGADSNSFFFYNRIKGGAEESISTVSGYKSIAFFRPSLLMGDRQEKRMGEDIARKVMPVLEPLMMGPLKKYRPIHAEAVARAMFNIARQPVRGVQIYESEEIKELAIEEVVSRDI